MNPLCSGQCFAFSFLERAQERKRGINCVVVIGERERGQMGEREKGAGKAGKGHADGKSK